MRTALVRVALLAAMVLAIAATPREPLAQVVSSLTLPTPTGAQRASAVAYDSTSQRFLLTWIEGSAIRGVTVDGAGVTTALLPITVPPSASQPRVAASSTGGFLLVWSEQAADSSWTVRAARLSAAGNVDWIQSLSSATGVQPEPAVAGGPAEFLVVWAADNVAGDSDVVGTRLGTDGSSAPPFTIAGAVTDERAPAAAWNGTSYMVAWEDAVGMSDVNISAAEIDFSGSYPSTPFSVTLAAGANELAPAVAASGSNYLVVWKEGSGSTSALAAKRLTSAGAGAWQVSPGAISAGTAVAGFTTGASSHAVASSGSGWVVTYADSGGAKGVGVREDGTTRPAFVLDDSAAGTDSAVAFGLGKYVTTSSFGGSGAEVVKAFAVDPLHTILTVSVQGGGSGAVTSSPGGIDCPDSSCSAVFAVDGSIVLTATANPTSDFFGWSGGCVAAGTSCTVTLAAPITITATFDPHPVPATPGAPTVTAVTASTVSLSWAVADGAVSYTVQRTTDSGGAPVVANWADVQTGITTTTWTDSGRAANTPYWYRVRAVNVAGYAESAPTHALTAPNAPAAPTFGAKSSSSIVVNWAAPTVGGAAKYTLQRKNGAGWDDVVALTTTLTATDVGRSAGVTYTYRVLAANSENVFGAPSPEASTTTLPASITAPTVTSVTASTVALTWATTEGAVSYTVQRTGDSGGTPIAANWADVQSGLTTTTWTDVGRTANTPYWYRVRAVNVGGYAESAPTHALTAPNAPAAPTFGAKTSSSIVVNWAAPAVGGAAKYTLQRKNGAGWDDVVALTAALTATDIGRSAGVTYTYRVLAANSENVFGSPSPEASATTLPDTPSTLAFSNVTTTTLTVSWTAGPGALSYKVERTEDATGAAGWQQVAQGVPGTSWSDASLKAGTIYWYRVRATSAGGDGQYSSSARVVTLPVAPSVPTLTWVDDSTSVQVSWTLPSGAASSYAILRATSANGTFSEIATANTTTYTDASTVGSTYYWYRVVAINAAGDRGAQSEAASLMTAPAQPRAISFSDITATSVVVTWVPPVAPVGTALTYNLEVAREIAGKPGAFTSVGSAIVDTSYAYAGLAPNTRYWFRVQATDAGHDGPFLTSAPMLTAPAVPPYPTPTFINVTQTSATFQWVTSTNGADSYQVFKAPDVSGSYGQFTVVASVLPTSNTVSLLSYTDQALAANTRYWYRVCAVNAQATACADPRVVTTLADAPTSTPAAPTYSYISSTSALVSWAAMPGADAYKLERTTDPSGVTGWVQVANQMAAVYSASGLAPNTTYWYRVKAYNSGGESAFSAPSSLLTRPAAPGPLSFSAVGPTSLTVSWVAPPNGATQFKVERAPSASGPFVQVAVVPGTTTVLMDSGLAENTQYYYRVSASNAAGDGAFSPIGSVRTAIDPNTPKPGAPGVPVYSSITATAVRVAWNAASGATAYTLERAGETRQDWSAVASGITTLSYSAAGLTPNTTFCFRVNGTNSGGAGPSSAESCVMTPPGIPGSPMLTASTGSVAVSWSEPLGGAASYKVERTTSLTSPFWTPYVAAGTAYVDANVTANTTYYYRISALNAEGRSSAPSGVAWVTTAADGTIPLPGVPGAPTFTAVRTSSVVVAWDVVADATSYTLERATDANNAASGWTVIAAGLRTVTFTDWGRAANTKYWYRVTASSAGGSRQSPASWTITAPNAPPAPMLASSTPSSVDVAWLEPVGGAVSYDVERTTSILATTWYAAATDLSARSIVDSAGLTGNTLYYYRVIAKNELGFESPPSGWRTVQTRDDQVAPPGAAGPLTFTNVRNTSVGVAWSAIAGASTYRVERSSSAAGPWTLIATGLAGLSYNAAGLTGNVQYWFRVSGSNSGGDGSPAIGSVLTAPNAPVGLQGVPGATSVTLTWSQPSGGAATFRVERALAYTAQWTVVTSTAAATCIDTNLVPNTAYSYRVIGINADGVSGTASSAIIVTTAPDANVPLPSAPSVSIWDIYSRSVTLGWDAVTGATTYRIERALDVGGTPGPWTLVTIGVTLTYFTDTGLTPMLAYWYRVQASGPGGTAYSTPVKVTTAPATPGAPTFSEVGSSSVKVSWTAPVGGAASYALERSTGTTGTWSVVAAGIVDLSKVDGGLTPTTTYYYRVWAVNADGTPGTYSGVRSVTTKAVVASP